MGVNINDKTQPFTDQILDGEKTIETRNKPTLHSYVGKRIGIIKTGQGRAMLVGYATVGQPVKYDTVEDFMADYSRHLVKMGSQFDIVHFGSKWGYPMLDVERTTPIPIYSRGIVSRKLETY